MWPLLIFIVGAIVGTSAFLLVENDIVVLRSPIVLRGRPTVTYLVGVAEYRRSPNDEWSSLAVSDHLREGATIRTQSDAVIDIRLNDASVLRLAEDTMITIDHNTLRRLSIHTQKGTVFSRLRRQAKRQAIELRSNSTVLGVRGTEVVFSVDSRVTVATLLSGFAEVYNAAYPDNRVLVVAEHAVRVSPDLPVREPYRLSRDTISAYRQTVDAIHADEVIDITTAIGFEPNTAVIVPDAHDELDRIARRLRRVRGTITIAGHTARVGDAGAMYALSVERAEEVRRRLVERGIAADRLQVIGFGAERPVATNDTREGRAQNRRVEFTVD